MLHCLVLYMFLNRHHLHHHSFDLTTCVFHLVEKFTKQSAIHNQTSSQDAWSNIDLSSQYNHHHWLHIVVPKGLSANQIISQGTTGLLGTCNCTLAGFFTLYNRSYSIWSPMKNFNPKTTIISIPSERIVLSLLHASVSSSGSHALLDLSLQIPFGLSL